MKIKDLRRKIGDKQAAAWPPMIYTHTQVKWAGPDVLAKEGILKGVRRVGDRLSLTVSHEGADYVTSLEVQPPPTVNAIEATLKAHIGKKMSDVAEAEVK